MRENLLRVGGQDGTAEKAQGQGRGDTGRWGAKQAVEHQGWCFPARLLQRSLAFCKNLCLSSFPTPTRRDCWLWDSSSHGTTEPLRPIAGQLWGLPSSFSSVLKIREQGGVSGGHSSWGGILCCPFEAPAVCESQNWSIFVCSLMTLWLLPSTNLNFNFQANISRTFKAFSGVFDWGFWGG